MMTHVLLIMKKGLSRDGMIRLMHQDADIQVVRVLSQLEDEETDVVHPLPDVILIHMDTDDTLYIRDIISFNKHYPEAQMLLILPETDMEIGLDAVRSGIYGLLLQKLFPHQLNQAIHDLDAGHYVLSGEIATMLMQHIERPATLHSQKYLLAEALQKRNIHMPDKHIEVASFLIQDYDPSTIAEILHINEKTIRSYVSHWIHKLHVDKRSQVIDYLKGIL